jgi:menaquinone-9 beta-reductase
MQPSWEFQCRSLLIFGPDWELRWVQTLAYDAVKDFPPSKDGGKCPLMVGCECKFGSEKIRCDQFPVYTFLMPGNSSSIEVIVIGAGLAGMSAAIHLAKAGVKVVCLEADVENNDPVGESLDWSAPELLKTLGFPMERLLEEGIATWKRHVILKLRSGAEQHYIPSDWLAKPPFNVELRTIHVDRTLLNRAIRKTLLGNGVELLSCKIVRVERDGMRIRSVIDAAGERLSARWFVDASGSAASLFPRTFQLPLYQFGPKKVAVWDYFKVTESLEGTTLHADGEGPPYMEWIWQIPVQPDTISVGYITTGDVIKQKRQAGLTVNEIYAEQLGHYPELERLLPYTGSPRTTSFLCRACGKTCGPNWLVIGESAAMVDPMTSNGVTAALRHAGEASEIIIRYRNREQIPRLTRALYGRRVLDMANFFNSGIEKVIYDWPIRNRIGTLVAGDVYTIPAWSINNIYSRIEPRGVVSTLLFGLFLGTLRAAMNVFYWFCRRSRSASPVCAVS